MTDMMEGFIFKIDGETFKVQDRWILSNIGEFPGIKTFITRKMDNDDCEEFGFGYVYEIKFIESGEVPANKSPDYIKEFTNNLPLYKAALDKYKKLITFI